MDALAAADAMVLFRNGVRQALRRAGYHASFVCRPPFPNIMSSGWHLHHSVIDRATGRNAFTREEPAPGTTAQEAPHTLSGVGSPWLAGLLAHGLQTLAQTAPGAGLFPFLVEDCLVGFIEQSSKFLKPVFSGDTLYSALEIDELTPGRTTGVLGFRTTIHNQRRELVLKGRQRYLLRRRPPAG